ncbi:hypothetical protein [Reticulibacter mediterranei]|uniref:hypothetical protein n=1 Tax=Reticulibacter mediterranei TaxID=2778369 RepID=UPI001C69246B|nr:hypothetical protein [Reticulibacter mediterranei]
MKERTSFLATPHCASAVRISRRFTSSTMSRYSQRCLPGLVYSNLAQLGGA